MKKFNSFRNRQNGFEDLGSGTAEAAKTKKSWACERFLRVQLSFLRQEWQRCRAGNLPDKE